MNAPAPEQMLSAWQVGIAALLILVNGALSIGLGLGLERRLAWAAVRTVAQLLLIGFVLQWVFASAHWTMVLAVIAAMTLIAGHATGSRGARGYAGLRWDGTLSVFASTWLIGAVGLVVVLQARPWYTPQYAIPIMGMILGNTLTGVGLALERMTGELIATRDQVETLLALGGTRWEAARGAARTAVRAGMTPIINQMSVVGVVSLPGMMTGQVLAGQSPLEAVRYQIVIMFLLAASSGLGTVAAVLLAYRRLFSHEHQLLSARIVQRAPGAH
ncbi:ABC transporter permease [Ralstonia solanacearum]|uniref:Abc-type uncharacterized transport system, permease component protein n=1 Tax=Ralstonia solanacearum (strain Po82) TaxID=1031711 RepID=F6G4V5_RALS8|nr:iron export ABC transporter permease subunit FetB [Ralstonia solanacearum]AEG69910.1 abc-type uncharacterized transport system, permease component protein [Ralstonia solanacearum Po82]AMP68072.1 ABC transporter permease [Ralstonia solanacearum]AMP75022.1 ABC transporter permease [Ralstonia solanacearum]MBB6585134.1 iron export ABC transporter permease subunit FetB [Ralstonia solanacearum]MCG3574400.1 iron export ABC transporter permease subunit FetB [Ralstonia solanacearum]